MRYAPPPSPVPVMGSQISESERRCFAEVRAVAEVAHSYSWQLHTAEVADEIDRRFGGR